MSGQLSTGRRTVAGPANTSNSFVGNLTDPLGGKSPFQPKMMTKWHQVAVAQRESASMGPIPNSNQPQRLQFELQTTVGHLSDQAMVRSDIQVTIGAARLWAHLKQCIAAGTSPLQYLHNIKMLPNLASHIYDRWELNHNGSKVDSKNPKVLRYMSKELYSDPEEAKFYANLTNGYLRDQPKKSSSAEIGGARYVRPIARQGDYLDQQARGQRIGRKDRWVVLPATESYLNVGKPKGQSAVDATNPGAGGIVFVEAGEAALSPLYLMRGTDQASLLAHEACHSMHDSDIKDTYYARLYHEIGCRDSPVFSGFRGPAVSATLSTSNVPLHNEIYQTNLIYGLDLGADEGPVFGDTNYDFYNIRPKKDATHGQTQYDTLWANNYAQAATGVGANNMTVAEKKLLVQYLQMNRIMTVLCPGSYGGKVKYDSATGKYSFSEATADQKLDTTVDKTFTYETRYVFQTPWHRGITDSWPTLKAVNNPQFSLFYKRPEEWIQNYNEVGGYVTVTIPTAELHTNYYDIPAQLWHANYPLERSHVWQIINYQFHNHETTLAVTGTGDFATNAQELTNFVNPNTLDRVARYLMLTVVARDHFTTGGTHNLEFKCLDLIKSIVFTVNTDKVGTRMSKPGVIEYDYQTRHRYFPHSNNHFPGEHIYIPFGIDNDIANMFSHQVDLATILQSMKVEIIWDQGKIEALAHHPDPAMFKQNYTITSGNVGGNATVQNTFPAKGGVAPSIYSVNGAQFAAGSEFGALEQTNSSTVGRGEPNATYTLPVYVEIAALVQEVAQMHTGQLQNAQG